MVETIDNISLQTPDGTNLDRLLYEVGKKKKPTLISHEVPLGLLEMSRWFNDYDYALVHLFDQYPQYYEFYKKSLELGRMVILDNSLYELGEAFDMEKYFEWIEKLHPTHYIIPDTFWDSQATIDQAIEWMFKYGNRLDPKIKKIGVAQGSTYRDIVRSYQFLDTLGCDVIAFTFKFAPTMIDDLDFKLDPFIRNTSISMKGKKHTGEFINEDIQALCRYKLLLDLSYNNVINTKKEHHLLGLQNTTLLYFSCLFPWITSIDTSNPIINGYLGELYSFNHEYNSLLSYSHSYIGNSGRPKPKEQLKDIFEKLEPGTPEYLDVIENIKHNVHAFREIVNPSANSSILLGNQIMHIQV